MIVKDRANLDKICNAMPVKNGNVVRQVPGVAVFLADLSSLFLAHNIHRSNCNGRRVQRALEEARS